MNIDLDKELKSIQKVAREFALKEVLPRVEEDEKNHRFQMDLVRHMGKLGFFGCPIPEEFGGTNAGFLAHVLVTEEISRASGSLRAAFNMQTMGTAREIYMFGTEEQKNKYISKLINAELLGCICITEGNAGSDIGGIQTIAKKDGNNYIINGSKNWITYAQVADLGLVYAYTEPEKKYKGLSAFIVDMHSKGIKVGNTAGKMGWHACPTGEIFFDEVRVPKENLLGQEAGRGFECVLAGLNNTRLTAAAGALGVSLEMIDQSIKYAKSREQFGKPIGQYQMIQEELARMAVETEASRLLVYKSAIQKDSGILNNTFETVMAKYYACDVASRVADSALRIFGAYGYSEEYPIERMFRDAKLYQIIEGSSNISKMIIGMDLLGYRKANR